MAKLKVLGWQGFRRDAPGNRCTREICAVSSFAAMLRETGKRRSDFFNITETGNAAEIQQATSEPGVTFWHGVDEHVNPVWRKA